MVHYIQPSFEKLLHKVTIKKCGIITLHGLYVLASSRSWVILVFMDLKLVHHAMPNLSDPTVEYE